MAIDLDKGSALKNLSLTPLIDIVFLLLIFFMVVSKFEQEERALDVELAAADAAQPMSADKKGFISIDVDGHFEFKRQILNSDQLTIALAREALRNPHIKIVIRPDAGCKAHYLVAAMNACKNAKIRDYQIATEKD
jgi:biopolymer transport protein ExbD